MTRGYRNNNPGSIRRTDTIWLGQASVQSDPDFVTFTDPQYGVRAIVKILRSYMREGINTVAEAIAHWAPPLENDTTAYITDVCADCGIQPNDPIDFNTIMPTLVKAIIKHEQGSVLYTDQQIVQWVSSV